MSGHWDDHDVVRMARRVRDVELALDARRQELEWVVSERDSLRARVAEAEKALRYLIVACEDPEGPSEDDVEQARAALEVEVE